MFCALLWLLCIHTVLFTSEITIQFVDDENKTVYTTESNIAWSQTLKGLVEDLGTEQPIPLHNVSKTTFEHIQSLMMDDTQKVIEYKNKTACSVKAIFRESARTKGCSLYISKPQFLIEANYLDIPKNCLQALTFFYARDVEKPTIIFHYGKIIFDNMPHDLEPFIAGWVNRNILKAINPEIVEYPLAAEYCTIIAGPIVSNAADDGSFAYIWEHPDSNNAEIDEPHEILEYNESDRKDRIYYKVCIVDKKQTPFYRRNIKLDGYIDKASCTLSGSKKHLLTTTFTDSKHIIQLYDLQPKMGTLKHVFMTSIESDIVATLFDHTNKSFCVIAKDKTDTFKFMTIDPALEDTKYDWETHKIPESYKQTNIMWSYVHGDLVGIDADNQTQKALVYKNNQLVEGSSESSDQPILNGTVNGKPVIIDYGIIGDYPGETKNKRSYYASEISYIPNMAKAMPRFAFLDYKHVSPFDVHNACINIIQDNAAITINFIPRKMRQMFQLCSKKLRAEQKNILPYAYATYCYYNNKETWQEKCAAFLPHMPEIGTILNDIATSDDKNTADDSDISSCTMS